jgi:hypothetical protein
MGIWHARRDLQRNTRLTEACLSQDGICHQEDVRCCHVFLEWVSLQILHLIWALGWQQLVMGLRNDYVAEAARCAFSILGLKPLTLLVELLHLRAPTSATNCNASHVMKNEPSSAFRVVSCPLTIQKLVFEPARYLVKAVPYATRQRRSLSSVVDECDINSAPHETSHTSK